MISFVLGGGWGTMALDHSMPVVLVVEDYSTNVLPNGLIW